MGSGEVLPDLPAYAGVWEVVRSYPISLPMLEYVKWCGPTRSPCTCWSVLGVVQPDHPTFPAFGLATFNQPPFSFLLPSWDLMIPHGSGQRMTRKHSSSPIVAGGNSGGNPTVRRIHGPAFRFLSLPSNMVWFMMAANGSSELPDSLFC